MKVNDLDGPRMGKTRQGDKSSEEHAVDSALQLPHTFQKPIHPSGRQNEFLKDKTSKRD